MTRIELTSTMLIGGRAVDSQSGKRFNVVNPATQDVICDLPEGDASDIAAAVEHAAVAYRDWARWDPWARAEALEAAARSIEQESERLALLDAAGSGNPLRASLGDVRSSLTSFRYFCRAVQEIKGQTIPVGPDVLDYTIRQPYGVVGRITPFNHPLGFAIEKVAAPLLAGNSVILKPSPFGAAAAVEATHLLASFLPPGVLSVVTDSTGGAGRALVRHPAVKRIAFTGSLDVAKQIMRDGADGGIKALSFELGGKNPLIIFPDADLDAVAQVAVTGMNLNRTLGQSCGSTSRVFVHASLHDAFVTQVRERFKNMRVGLPTDPETDYGCLASEAQLRKVETYVDLARSEGAVVEAGGYRPTDAGLGDGFFYAPTLLTGVDQGMRVAQEEVFGPVLSVIRWDSIEHLLRDVNTVEYGLTANIWTNDLATAHQLAARVEAGYVWINGRDGRHFPGAPFGGLKNSGIGSESSLEELLSYTELKNVSVWLPSTLRPWN